VSGYISAYTQVNHQCQVFSQS